MQLDFSKKILSKFALLEGNYSQHFESKISKVFIGFRDPILTREKYQAIVAGIGFPSLPSDNGTYTICAKLERGQIVSVRELIENDNVEDLNIETVLLDYMYVAN